MMTRWQNMFISMRMVERDGGFYGSFDVFFSGAAIKCKNKKQSN